MIRIRSHCVDTSIEWSFVVGWPIVAIEMSLGAGDFLNLSAAAAAAREDRWPGSGSVVGWTTTVNVTPNAADDFAFMSIANCSDILRTDTGAR